jgi:hypothetical protein
MPPATETVDADLDKALDKIESHLDDKDEAAKQNGADLAKALTEVAKGAIDLAKDKKKKGKGKTKAEPLVKARDEDCDDDDDDEAADDDEKPAWLKKKTLGKAIDWHALAQDLPEASKTAKIAKSITVGDMDVFNMDEYLAAQLEHQQVMAKSLEDTQKTLRQFVTLTKGLLQAMSQMEDRLIEAEDRAETQTRTLTVMAKAMAYQLETHETALEAPATSKYAAMEKSVAQAQRALDAQGYTVFEPTRPNLERLSKAVMSGKLSQEDSVVIKRTHRLPPGVTLN